MPTNPTAITVQVTVYTDGKQLKSATLDGLAALLAKYAIDHRALFNDDSLRGRLVINFDTGARSLKPEAELVIA